MELHTRKEIEEISLDILRSSKSLDIFPTPVKKIVDYTELMVNEGIDVSQIHPSYLSKANNALKRALSKVRGVFDFTEKTIYLDLSQSTSRKNFVQLHEVAHGVLPWQKGVHEVLGEDDDTLSIDANEDFEDEANFFASITLFQHDRFKDEIEKLELSIKAPMQLSKQFGASVHATLRNYVNYSKKRCALIVLEGISKKGSQPTCNVRNIFQSAKFEKAFGKIEIPMTLGYTWDFVKHYYLRHKFIDNGSITLPTNNEDIECSYHYFYNGYNAFVFLFPVGEKKSTRTKIIMKGTST